MTRKRVADEQFGRLQRRLTELARRVDEGAVPYDATMDGLQALIEDRVFATGDFTWIGEVSVDYGTRPSFRDLHGVWFDWANKRFDDTAPELRKLSGAKPLPTSGIVKHRYGYVLLNQNATDGQALVEIAKCDVVPATDLEAMYVGKAFPGEQRKSDIVALRTSFRTDGYCCSAVLSGCDTERRLGLGFGTVDYPWGGSVRFLVREDDE